MFPFTSEVSVRRSVYWSCLAGILALALFLPSGADASVLAGGCLLEESPPVNFNCTSNDLTFVLVGLGTQTNGCVQSGLGNCSISGGSCASSAECPMGETCEFLDEVDIFMRAIIRNTTAQTRYDVGMWVSTDGDPNGDGALSGGCGREMIHPVRVCTGGTNNGFPCDFDQDCGGGTCGYPAMQTCPPLDLIGDDPAPIPPAPQGPANGPYYTGEPAGPSQDFCGDLRAQNNNGCDENMDSLWDDSVLDFTSALTVPCNDIDEDGFVNIPTCATWGQGTDEIALGTCSAGSRAGLPCTQPSGSQGCPGGTCVARGVCSDQTGATMNIGMSCTSNTECGGAAGSCQRGAVAINTITGTCETEAELFPGTAAKCRCEQVNSNIPNPDLSLQCSLVNQCTVSLGACSNDTDCPGGMNDVCVTPSLTMPEMSSRIFDLTFTNGNPPSCMPDSTPANLTEERFQCGTASFMQWELADDQIDGNPENGTFENVVIESTGGTATGWPGNGILWTPRNDLEPLNMTSEPGALGVIYPGHTGTLRFKYRLGDFMTFPDSVTINATTFWSNDQSFMPRVAQDLTASCPLVTVDTWAAVSNVRAFTAAGGSVVEWTTTTEVATKAFELYRLEGRSWAPVGDGPIASRMAGDGAVYRVPDSRAYPGETATYRLVEVTYDGARRSMGPYTVTVAADARDAVPGPSREARFGRDPKGTGAVRDGSFAPAERSDAPAATGALEHAASPRQAARLRQANRELVRARQRPMRVATATLKAEIVADGVHRLPAADLAAQWGLSEKEVAQMIAGGLVRVSNRGNELAYVAAADGSALYFPGERAAEVDTAANVYRIEPFPGTLAATVAGGNPAPVAGGVFQDRLVLEANNVAATNSVRQPNVDFWFWKGLEAPSAHSFAVGVPGATGGAGTLSVRFYSVSDTSAPLEHTAIVRVNGVEVGQTSWEDIRFHDADFAVPAGALVDGANQIEVEAFLAGGVATSAFFVDRFTLDYERELRAEVDRLVVEAAAPGPLTVSGFSGGPGQPPSDLQVLDVTDPLAVRQVTGVTVDYAGDWRASFEAEAGAVYEVARGASLPMAGALRVDVPSRIKASPGAQYVVVAPAHLLGQANGLKGLRRYLSTMLIDVEDVYDEFNHGLASPRAIRELMVWAAQNWSVRPEYLVLVGAGTFDYKDYQGHGGNLIPPALVGTPQGIYASDHWFGDVDGDEVPDVAVGRIPVLTAGELQGYVQKLRRLERDSGPDWRGSALFLADDLDPQAGDFKLSTNRVSAHLGAQFALQKIFRDDLPAATAKQQLIDALNAGVGYFNYLGHGGVTKLADEDLLTADDAALLTNADRPTVMASLTCVAGRFEIPTFDSLAEAMLLNPNGGAVAAWAPSGLSYNVDAERLNRAFVDAAFGQEITVGEAVRRALAEYAGEGYYRHLLLVYNLFGDPALSMR